jgi:hypothetical protein
MCERRAHGAKDQGIKANRGNASAAFGWFLLSCATVPQYDQTTDTSITALQKEVDTQLVQWLALQRAGDPASR